METESQKPPPVGEGGPFLLLCFELKREETDMSGCHQTHLCCTNRLQGFPCDSSVKNPPAMQEI